MVKRSHLAWAKTKAREVKNTLSRYLAILAIVALGVGFFTGLKETKGDMVATGDSYISAHHMYDYRLISTLGLTKDDAAYISELDGVKMAEAAYSQDFISELEDGDSINVRAHSISNNINTVSLTAGRVPDAPGECVADARYFKKSDIGKTLTVSKQNDGDTISAFACDKYTIVGIANSVLYLNIERGTTTLTGGKINAFIFIPASGFSLDYYTDIYVSINSDGEIYSDAYKSSVDAIKTPLTDALEKRGEVRWQSIVDEATTKVDDAQAKYDKSLADYNTQKADTEKQLADAEQSLSDAADEIAAQGQKLEDGKTQLAQSKIDYQNGLDAYNAGFEQYKTAKIESENQLADAQAKLDSNNAALSAALSAAKAGGDAAQINALSAQLAALSAAQIQLDSQKSSAEKQLADTAAQLSATKTQLDNAATEIANAENTLIEGQKALDEGKAEYASSLKKYEDSKAQAKTEFADAEKKLTDAKTEIDDARKKVGEIEKPNVYVLDRTLNTGYASFENDSSIVEGISRIFPVFFFLVAALVCTTTMARMVEEQRSQIGTFKALGYSDGAVAWKYVSYSGSAAIIGCVLGYFGGTRMFPYVIWKAYGMLYGFAPVLFVDDWWLFALSIIVALACSAGVTFVTCRAELTLMPAELMRPKSPKAGKRVLLERVKIIWNRLSFLQKVSFRNIFRYKKRLFMMALGIGGCTALLLTGFGIRNSITGIASEQYGEIMKYDLAITFDSGKTTDEIAKFKTDTSDFLSDSVFFCADSADLKTDKGIKTANIIATGDPDITKMINLSYKGKSVKYPPDGSVAVSDKLALFANVKVGDKITLDLSDGSEREVTVSDIFENHAYHYILMTDVTYKSLFGNECDYSDALLTVSTIDIHDASTKLLNDFDAVNVTVTEDIRNHINHMMVSLDYIIYVIIACAGALAFVVLFNLDNINITERVREIATIKVLGFYAPEVGSYVFRENIVLTTIGAAVGIPLGIWLNSFVMGQVDIDMLSFTIKINPLSYFLAIAITFAFDITVDLLMRRKLGAINMVESLKSVE